MKQRFFSEPVASAAAARARRTTSDEPGIGMGDDGAACVRIHPSSVDVDEFDPEIVRAVADGAPASKVKRLLLQGADVNAVTSHGWSGLYLAVLNNDLDNVKLLLKWGAHTDYVDEDGDDLLLCAICNERPEPDVVVELLCAGMVVDERTRARALVELKYSVSKYRAARREIFDLCKWWLFDLEHSRAFARLRLVR